MVSNEAKKINIINMLISELRIGNLDSNGIILVREDRMRVFLDNLPPEVLFQIEATALSVRPPVNKEDFKNWTISRRKVLGLSQSELARKVGIRPEQMNRYEKGTHPLNEEHLLKIEELLRLPNAE